MLEIKNLSMTYDSKPLLTKLNLNIETGEIVALTGPSGSGKTTLLRCIAGLESPTSGSIHLNNQDITRRPAHLRRVGLVFQDNQLFPHLNVGQNIGYALKIQRVAKQAIKVRVEEALDLVGLGHLINREVTNLSGGEAKRVAVARAIVADPEVLLLDEPLSGLDTQLHGRLLEDLKSLLLSRGTTTLHVTHDLQEAATIASRVVDLRQLIS